MNQHILKELKQGVSPYHVVEQMIEQLAQADFLELSMTKDWELKEGGKYYISHHGSTLIAFVMPKDEDLISKGMHISAAHTDFPGFRIKANPDLKKGKGLCLNTEVYGGGIHSSWFDRPLTVAGKVMVDVGGDAPKSVLFESKHPIGTIPSVAIHLNKEANKGMEYNRQNHLVPFVSTQEDNFLDYVAEELQVKPTDILAYDLGLAIAEEPMYVGLYQDMISSPRIDNLSSVVCMIEAMKKMQAVKQLSMIACFDHEEIGSGSKQGAASLLLRDVIEKIYTSKALPLELARKNIYQGMMLSVDVAHGLHPNFEEKSDPVNKPLLNKGLCIKEAFGQSYATDVEGIGTVLTMAKRHNIPTQIYTNRSDLVGGGTLGAIANRLLPMITVDIGIPILGMHSARELMGTEDAKGLQQLLEVFLA